jgi:predicted O-linked N-acetylglucosamine transferase (SPINDLY family)
MQAEAMSETDTATMLRAATAAHEAGRLEQAKALYLECIEHHPYEAEAHHGLGWLLVQQGDWSAAIKRFVAALKFRPWEPEYWISQLEALMHMGQFEAVHRLLYRARESGLPQAQVAAFENRLTQRRIDILTAAVKASGKSVAGAAVAPHDELMAMRQAFLDRRFDDARKMAALLVKRFPLAPFAWRVLAASTPIGDHPETALELRRLACDVDPEGVDAAMNLALALHDAHRFDEAEHVYDRVLEKQPENLRALVNLGLLLGAKGDAKAGAVLRRARKLGSDDLRVALALGGYLRDQDQPDEAIPLLEEVLAKQPESDLAISALSVCYLAVGRHEESAALFRRMNVKKIDELHALGIALFVGTHLKEVTAAELFDLHRRYGQILESGCTPFDHHENDRNPHRKLRVGFVSGDLRSHAMASFVAPMWEGLNTEQIEIFAYSNHATVDQTTVKLRSLAHAWCEIQGMGDEAVAARIRKDAIDVLVDLSGHTAFHRLGVFALKPAPVQVSWGGYPATTGLTRMDYYMADAIFAPPGLLDDQFTEKLMQGPACASFQPAPSAPDVAPLPSSQGAPFTFGSFNRMSKLTPMTLDLWAAILVAAPHTRMMIGAADAASQERLRAHFARAGVDASRLTFLPRMDMSDYLAAHAQVDVLLDTSPYAGGTTTCHGLWMGLPTLTLTGATLPTRAGAALMGRAGLVEFIATGPEDFVARGVALAAPEACERLKALREGMRDRVLASNIVSPRAAIESFEDAVRMAWARWCQGLPPVALLVPARLS